MQDIARILGRIKSQISRVLGVSEINYLTAGDSTNRVYKVQAEGAALTYSATTSDGDNLSGVTLGQDKVLTGEFDSFSVDGGSSGSAIVWKF